LAFWSLLTVSFFANWAKTAVDPVELALGWVVPAVPAYAVAQAVGCVGAVIMPHNLYLHSGLVLSRKVNRSNPQKVWDAICYNRLESAVALLVAFFVNLAVLAANAGNFYSQTCAELDGGPFACLASGAIEGGTSGLTTCNVHASGEAGFCSEIGLQGEGAALQHTLGKVALYVWAIGLLAAGQAATMTCTYAGQVIMGGCLQIRLAPWKRVAFTRAMALGPSILVAAATVGNDQLFNYINEYLNVLQSLQLPFAMLPVLYMTSQAGIMGRFKSSCTSMTINFCLAGVVLFTNVVLIIQFVEDWSAGAIAAVCVYGVLYAGLCVKMIFPSKQEV